MRPEHVLCTQCFGTLLHSKEVWLGVISRLQSEHIQIVFLGLSVIVSVWVSDFGCEVSFGVVVCCVEVRCVCMCAGCECVCGLGLSRDFVRRVSDCGVSGGVVCLGGEVCDAREWYLHNHLVWLLY